MKGSNSAHFLKYQYTDTFKYISYQQIDIFQLKRHQRTDILNIYLFSHLAYKKGCNIYLHPFL